MNPEFAQIRRETGITSSATEDRPDVLPREQFLHDRRVIVSLKVIRTGAAVNFSPVAAGVPLISVLEANHADLAACFCQNEPARDR